MSTLMKDQTRPVKQPDTIVLEEPSTAQQGVVWWCQSCGHTEEVQNDVLDTCYLYNVGDTEPCIHCDEGVAEVVRAGFGRQP